MAISKKLVEKMGGTINLESEKGVGTTFVIRVPFRINTDRSGKVEIEKKSEVSIRGLHILLAEDNELNMEISEFVLRNEGADVTKAWNGQEAVERFRKSRVGEFNVILMDIMMPVKNGYEAARLIRSLDREDAKTIPIIAMTANAFTEDRIRAKEAGMDEHVAKPVDAELLIKVIHKLGRYLNADKHSPALQFKGRWKIVIYITGDTHGKFERIEQFCGKFKTSREDILIILGDAGINFFGWVKDHVKKEFLETLPITFFCVHGNHEQRPQTIESYREKLWRGGVVYYEEEYPDLLFAKDGEVFDFNGKQTIVTGGAYSVDRMYRLIHGYGWWPDEQPSEEIKQNVEQKLDELSWNVDVVLSHTVPLKYEPTEVFLEGLDQSKVDRTTEEWLDKIEDRLNYQKWYCGHYHTEKKVDKIEIMFENIKKFLE